MEQSIPGPELLLFFFFTLMVKIVGIILKIFFFTQKPYNTSFVMWITKEKEQQSLQVIISFLIYCAFEKVLPMAFCRGKIKNQSII